MNKRSFLSLLLIVPLLVGGIAYRAGAAEASISPAAISSDIAVHGTAWVPQKASNFSLWQPLGWGTAARAKYATDLWVHIPLNYPTYINGVAQRLLYVEFCAASSNSAISKPKSMDVWSNITKISTQTITWTAGNNVKQCVGQIFSKWYEDVGISVLLHYGNTTDTITLLKAWVHVGP